MNIKPSIGWFGAALCASFLVACQPKAPPAQHALPVHVLEITPQAVPLTLETPGQTAGSSEVEVRSRVSGILKEKNYTEGAYVQKGAVLFTLDTDTSTQAYKAAVANVAIQSALLKQAQANHTRVKALAAQDALSQRDLEAATASLNTASASFKAAQAQAESSKLSVDYGVIRAPISGYTSSETRSVGSLVSPQDMLTKISVIEPMYVNFSFSDGELAKLQASKRSGEVSAPTDAGFDVALTLADGTEYPQKGRLNFTDKIVSSTTGTIKARAVFANPRSDLLPGQSVKVALRGAVRNDVIVVPQRAVASSIQGKSVWVVTPENTLEARPVVLADTVGQNVVVIKGLQPGDKVALDRLMMLPQLPPGAKVAPAALSLEAFYESLKNPTAPAPAPAADAKAKE